MKKLIFLFACLSVLALTSCKDKESAPLENLTGTTWIYTAEEVGFKATATLTFQANTFRLVSEAIEDGEKTTDETTGSYTYAFPVVTLTPNIGGEKPMAGIVSDDTISFKDEGEVLVFTRQ